MARRLTYWVLVLALGMPPSVGNCAVIAPEPGVLGIVRGTGGESAGEHSYELLEKRLERWLQDRYAKQLRVLKLDSSEQEQKLQFELERLQLGVLSEELLEAGPGRTNSVLLAKVR